MPSALYATVSRPISPAITNSNINAAHPSSQRSKPNSRLTEAVTSAVVIRRQMRYVTAGNATDKICGHSEAKHLHEATEKIN